MKLFTKEVIEALDKMPLRSQDGKGKDAKVIVKFFNPYGRGTWLITEAEKQSDGSYLLWGYCNIFEWEWGYITSTEIEKTTVFGFLHLERDSSVKPFAKTVKEPI